MCLPPLVLEGNEKGGQEDYRESERAYGNHGEDGDGVEVAWEARIALACETFRNLGVRSDLSSSDTRFAATRLRNSVQAGTILYSFPSTGHSTHDNAGPATWRVCTVVVILLSCASIVSKG